MTMFAANNPGVRTKAFSLLSLCAIAAALSLLPGSISSAVADDAESGGGKGKPAGKFGLVMVELPDSYEAVRWNRQTGEAWTIHNNTTRWTRVKEPEPVPAGEFEVQMSTWKQNNTPYFASIRVDAANGKSWYLSKGQWLPLQEPEKE